MCMYKIKAVVILTTLGHPFIGWEGLMEFWIHPGGH